MVKSQQTSQKVFDWSDGKMLDTHIELVHRPWPSQTGARAATGITSSNLGIVTRQIRFSSREERPMGGSLFEGTAPIPDAMCRPHGHLPTGPTAAGFDAVRECRPGRKLLRQRHLLATETVVHGAGHRMCVRESAVDRANACGGERHLPTGRKAVTTDADAPCA